MGGWVRIVGFTNVIDPLEVCILVSTCYRLRIYVYEIVCKCCYYAGESFGVAGTLSQREVQ